MGLEVGEYSISCHFRNCDDELIWMFMRVYGPSLMRDREGLFVELGTINRLWDDPWCIGSDFNIIMFPRECSGVDRLKTTMTGFFEILEDF